MPTVGSTLAAERVRQGRTLGEIAARTKISLLFLQAIEIDDFEQLPGRVFVRNFVRQYAQELGLDSVHILAQYDREQSTPSPDFGFVPEPAKIKVPRLPQAESALSRIFESNALSAFATFVLTIAVCGVAYYAYDHWPRSAPAPARATAPSPDQPKPAPVAAAPPPAEAADMSNVRVALSATEPCWTRIVADGKTLFAGLLSPGDQKTVDATENVTIRAGNAGALSLKLNGNEVPAIGPKGQIRTVVLTADGAHVRTPTPELGEDF